MSAARRRGARAAAFKLVWCAARSMGVFIKLPGMIAPIGMLLTPGWSAPLAAVSAASSEGAI